MGCVPLQVPSVAVTVAPSVAETSGAVTGSTVFAGATPLTGAVFSDSALAVPAMFLASTFTRSVCLPTSSDPTKYVARSDAPDAVTHPVPDSSHRSHSYSNVTGSVPVHLPLEAVSSCPSLASPEIEGSSAFFGPTPSTSLVTDDSFSVDPATFFAVTSTRRVCAASPFWITYVDLVSDRKSVV